jgi:hypothetical protein
MTLRVITGQDVLDIEAAMSPNRLDDCDWFHWIHHVKGYTGDESMSVLSPYYKEPLWIFLMTRCKGCPDWHRVLSVCNVHWVNQRGRNAYFYASFTPSAIPHLVRAGVDWRQCDHVGTLPLMYLASMVGHECGKEQSAWELIDLYLEHDPKMLAYLTENVPASDALRLIFNYRARAIDRWHRCRSATLQLYAVLRLRLGVPRDVARLFAQRVWCTRAERLGAWDPEEEEK